MSNLLQLSIDKILDTIDISTVYKSIDIRAILAKLPKKKSKWECIFLKIRLTIQTKQELEELYNIKKTRLGEIDTEDFKVKLLSYDINEFQEIVKQIKNGYITIKGIRSRINGNLREQLKNVTATKSTSYSTNEEMSGYSHYLIPLSRGTSSIATYLQYNMGIKNIDYDRLAVILETQNLNDGNPNNIVIIFPIYCRKISIQQDDVGKLISKYNIHKSFLNQCTANVIRSNPPEQYNPVKIAEHVELNGVICTVDIPKVFEISPDDSIRIDVVHDKLGNLSEDNIDTNDILIPPYGYDILADSFQLFKAKENLKEYFISKKDPQYQVLATSWFLGLVGFRIITLGILDKKNNEHIFENQIQTLHSADILAEDSGILLVVDCTVSVPTKEKIIKIRNTANYITKKINKTIFPVIFSAVDCSTLKDDTRYSGVYIIDSRDIDLLCDQILKGHSTSVRDTFFNYLTSIHDVITRFLHNRSHSNNLSYPYFPYRWI